MSSQFSDASPLTPEQSQAVAARQVSVVLSSGAGCGKTHVLTERYLSHLLQDRAEVGQIVAITFTDRAARQMRSRIRQVLVKQLREAPDEEADAWTRHLRALETAPISTIHAFCGTLLRQHATEAGLDARFEVLEEVLAANLETEALHGCLQKLLTSPTEAGEDLRQLVLLFGWRSVVEGVKHLLRSWEPTRWDPFLNTSAAEVARDWQEHFRKRLLPRYLDYLGSGRPAIARCLALLQMYPPQDGPMRENVRLLQQEWPRLAEAADLAAAVKQLTEAAKVGRVGVKAWPDPDVYEQIKKAFEDFRTELRNQQLERFAAPSEDLDQAAVAGQRLGRVVREVAHTYSARKRQYGVVDFQDLILLTRDLLRDHREVRERLQERYRFILLDEVQDTDPLQMELLELLCGAERTTGKLFAVGDLNQSIYRFRGADVRQFQKLRRDVPHEGRLGLTMNFRSQPAILDFTNALLGHRLADYEPLRAFHPQVNPGPCVEFLWSPRPEQGGITQGRLVEADWIARRLAGMIGRETLVVDRETPAPGPETLRPVQAGDVVLLFRAMSNVPLYETALRRCGLDYYLVGGRAFFAQQEIYDLLNLLRALENPQDGVSLAGALRSPFCCLSDEALFVLARHREGLWAGLRDENLEVRLPAERSAVRRARDHLWRWRHLKDRLPIARLLGVVFADSGFDAATQFEPLGDRKLANLWKLMDLARTFDRSGLFGLAEFITRLGELVANQAHEEQASTQPENANVIRLMSIHQAKGLEFPVVLIPDLLAVGGGASQPLAEWDDQVGCVARPPRDDKELPFPDFGWQLWQAQSALEEWQEDLRTLYVACTRARDYLILSSSIPEPFQPSNAWTLTLVERFDPATGRCLAPGISEERRPRVCVFDRLRPPPELPLQVPQPGRQAMESAVGLSLACPEPLSLPCWDPEAVLPLEEFEDWSRRKDTLWNTAPHSESLPVERLLRRVLARWDFADPEGWRPWWQQLPATEEAALLKETAERLQRLAACSFRQQLAERDCQKEVEFLFRGEESQRGPVLRGLIDCLWRDEQAGWHLLFYAWQPEASVDRELVWKERLTGLVLAAAALREQTGGWPRSVGLWFLDTGEVLQRAGRHLPHRRILTAVARDLWITRTTEGGG